MAHSANIISSIKLPNNTTYEIHDAKAIHDISDLALASVLVFKGTQTSEAEVLALTSAKQGDVWLVPTTGVEYVCTKTITAADSTAWEKLGDIHDAASSTHTHTATVTGTNASSTVTGKVTVPTVTSTTKYLSASATGTAIGSNGTVNAITGLGTATTAEALGANATFSVTGGTATTSKMETDTASYVSVTNKDIPNVTANTTVTASKVSNSGSKTNGTAASWSASVSSDGVLSFSWTANTPTAVTLPTFTNVTATNTTLGTAIKASEVTASDVTVATGALSSAGAGAIVATGVNKPSVSVNNADAVAAITALGTPTTKAVLTGVKVTTQPTVTLTVNDATATGRVAYVSGVTVGSTEASLQNGSAAAQKWTQASGTTGQPK